MFSKHLSARTVVFPLDIGLALGACGTDGTIEVSDVTPPDNVSPGEATIRLQTLSFPSMGRRKSVLSEHWSVRAITLDVGGQAEKLSVPSPLADEGIPGGIAVQR